MAQDTDTIGNKDGNFVVATPDTSTGQDLPKPNDISPETKGVEKIEKKDLVEPKRFVPNPNKSMWYGLIFPGLGQIYNRKYWKLPIVYGGFAALGYGIGWNHKYYTAYKQYYRDITDSNPNTKSYEELYTQYDPSVVTEARLKDMMDNLRRYRDLCIIGSVAFYAITVLDAFVDASLADFDISPYLSLKVAPTILETDYNSANLALKLNLKF